MKATASQKIKIGVFTIIALLVLMGGIFAIGNQRNLFAHTFLIYGDFKNISGLQIGNNVRFNGINVGTITGINIENDTTIRVVMSLKEKVHPFLKADATASIGSDGLMGDKLINITPGIMGSAVLTTGGIIKTVNPIEFDKIINRISNVADNADKITSSLAGIATQINSGKGSIGRLIYSDSLEKGLESTVRSTHATINAVHNTIDSAGKGVQSFQENMTALKHNFLLKGYYKKKEKKERKLERKEERKERRLERKEEKQEIKAPENNTQK